MLDTTTVTPKTPLRRARGAFKPRLHLAALLLTLGACGIGVYGQGNAATSAADEPHQAPSASVVRERRAVKKQEQARTADAPAADADEAATKSEKQPESDAATTADGESEEPAAGAGEGETNVESAKTDAERARLRRTLAEQLAEKGRKSEAVTELRAMLGEERFDPQHFYNVGNALARLGESSASADAYRKAISQRRGRYSRAQHNLGVVQTRLGRWEEAREALTAAVRIEGGIYPEASYSLGRLHALRGEAGLAIKEWTRVLTHKPDHADAAIALARALAEDGDAERGLAVLDTFTKKHGRLGTNAPREIAVARGEIVAAMNLADADRKSRAALPRADHESSTGLAGGTYRRGAGSLRSLAVDQQTYDLLRRARAARESERNEEAVAFYRRVISNRGGYFPPANLEVSYALISLKRDGEAVATLRAVADRDGSRYPIAFYHLGRLYERLGQLRNSAEAFTRAAAHFGDDNRQVLVELSLVNEKEGDLRAAVEAMEKYVSAAERAGDTSEWSRERLARLRQKLSALNAPVK